MTYIHNTKTQFESIRNNQLQLLRNMIDKSVLKTTINYLNMGLEDKYSQHLAYQQEGCIQNIRVKHKYNERIVELHITWAQKIAQTRARLTCRTIIRQRSSKFNIMDSNTPQDNNNFV